MSKKIYHITAELDGVAVGDFLIKMQGVSRRTVVKLKHYADGMLLNGSHIRTIDAMKAGDILEINIHDEPKETYLSTREAAIIYEDEDLMAFDKPPDMPTHQSRTHFNHTLGNVFAAEFARRGERKTYRPVCRLDKDTSGIVLVAKNPIAADKLMGATQKTYTAIVHGLPPDCGRIDAPIARLVPEQPERGVREDGQNAVTNYRVEKRLNNYSVVSLELETGRTHQIRVHMAHIGHPLAGDLMYGGAREIIERHALHCGYLAFNHPLTLQRTELFSPLPADMAEAIVRMS